MKISKPFATAGASLALLMNAACATSDYGAYLPERPPGSPYGASGGSYADGLGRYATRECQLLASFDRRAHESRAGRETSQALGNLASGVLGGRSGDQIARQAGRDFGDILQGGNRDAATARQRESLVEGCEASNQVRNAGLEACTDSSRTTTYTRERDGNVRMDRRGAETQNCRSVTPYIRAPQAIPQSSGQYEGGVYQGPASQAPSYYVISPKDTCRADETRARVIVGGQETLACVMR